MINYIMKVFKIAHHKKLNIIKKTIMRINILKADFPEVSYNLARKRLELMVIGQKFNLILIVNLFEKIIINYNP